MCWSSHCCVVTPKQISRKVIRVSFGLSILFVGIAHYRTINDFAAFVGEGLGPLTVLGKGFGYVLPALMIAGGALFVIGKYPKLATWLTGIALGVLPAGILLKSAISSTVTLGDTMPGAVNAFTWIIIFMLVCKGKWSCSDNDCCSSKGGCGCGTDCKGGCGCGSGGCSGCGDSSCSDHKGMKKDDCCGGKCEGCGDHGHKHEGEHTC